MGLDSRMFSEGKVGKVLLKFAIPAIVSLLVAELYNMVDTFFVGRHVGPEAIGALTIAFPIQRLMVSIGMLIAVGTSTAVARYLGEENYDDLKKTIVSAISISIIAMVILPLLIFIFINPILVKMGASEIILPLAREYISVILIGSIFQGLTFVLCYSMNALGNTKITLISTSIGAVANMIIDGVLVSVFGMGVLGAAIATVVSQTIAFGVAYYKFLQLKKSINLKYSFSFYGDLIKTIIAIGFSTFVIEISDAIVAVLLNNILSDHGGDVAIIIVGVITRISMFMYIFIIGISSAMQPIVAFNYGAKNFKRVNETIKKSIIAITGTSVVLWMVMMVFAKVIIGSFLKESDMLVQAVSAFRICISVFPIIGLYYVSIYVYQAIGEAKVSFLLSIYRQLVIFIPMVIFMVNRFGVTGAWVTYPIVDIISALTGLFYISKAKKDIEEERREYSLGALSIMGK